MATRKRSLPDPKQVQPTQPQEGEGEQAEQFLAMEGIKEKTAFVAEQFDVLQARRRGEKVKGEEKKSYQSNYNHLLELIRMERPKASEQASFGQQANLGPILEAKREEEKKAKALNNPSKGRPGKLRTTVQSQRSVAQTPAFVFEAEGGEVPPPTETQAKKAADLATTAVGKQTDSVHATLKAQAKQQSHERNQKKSRDFDQRLQEGVQAARPKLTRKKSWPHTTNNYTLLSEAFDELHEVSHDNQELRAMVSGAKPRKEEVALGSKIETLELQIVNQMALIKGLREKLKVATEKPTVSVSASSPAASFRGAASGRPEVKGVPNSDLATVVFVDVQSSQYLKEALPEIMPAQIALYVKALRDAAQPLSGYEVRRLDERFVYAFHNPFDALKWCNDVQLRLVQLDWHTELCENADTPTESLANGGANDFLWRGLRVSMGIQVGASSVKDPFTGSVIYEGHAIQTASFIQTLATGGEILFTEDVNRSVNGAIANMGLGLIQPWDALGVDPQMVQSGAKNRYRAKGMVYRFVPSKLKDRLRLFQRDLASVEKYQLDLNMFRPGASKPPSGTVTLVAVAPVGIATLMEGTTDTVQQEALGTLSQCFEQALKDSRGYLSREHRPERRILVAFQNCAESVRFALRLQSELVKREWPPELNNMTEFGTVSLKGTTLFQGIRLRIGIHCTALQDVVDDLTGLTIYQGPDAAMCSNLANTAVDGEILVSQPVLDEISKHSENLGSPFIKAAVQMSIATRDAMVQTFQVLPKLLAARSAYTSRDQKLGDEPPDTHRTAVEALEKQIETLQVKLEAKDKTIGHLEEQVREKSALIGELRNTVVGIPFKTVHYTKSFEKLTKPTPITRGECVLMALSFAHADKLYDAWGDEMPAAMEVLDTYLESALIQNHAQEVRRSPSGVVRVLQFVDTVRAAEFWLSLVRNSLHLEWPGRLDDSDFAGAALASEFIPDIHSSLEGLVWKGLRPIAAVDIGTPTTHVNATTLLPEIIGEQMNFVSLLLRECTEGDCIFSPRAAEDLFPRMSKLTEAILADYGPYHRLLAGDMIMRNRIIRKFFPHTEPIDTDVPLRTSPGAVVQVLRQRSVFLKDDTVEPAASAIPLFETTLLRQAEEYGGSTLSTNSEDFTFVFPDLERGAEFSLHIHTALLNAPWDAGLLRCHDFKEVISDRQMLFKGIRAAVGFHVMEEAAVSVDMFSGLDLWLHDEIHYSVVLAHNAHFGETVMSEPAKLMIQKVHGKRMKSYIDTIGSMIAQNDPLPISLYQAVPSLLKGRVVTFIEDDKQTGDPNAIARRQKAEVARRNKLSGEMERDQKALSEMDRNLNLKDTIKARFKKLHAAVKEKLEADRSKFVTSMATLEICETASMMSEDPFYLQSQISSSQPKSGVPTHTNLLLHQLQFGSQHTHPSFHKAYAAELISGESSALFGGGGGGGVGGGGGASRPVVDETVEGLDDTVDDVSGGEGGGGNQTSGILPEDVVQIHIDVQRFANLLLLHGPTKLEEVMTAWLAAVYDDCVGDHPEGTSDETKLHELSGKVESLGMDLTTVDMELMRISVVANLSVALQSMMKAS